MGHLTGHTARRVFLIGLFLAIGLCATDEAAAKPHRDTLGVGTQVLFTENAGQWNSPVRYAAQLHNAALFLEDGGIVVALREPTSHPYPSAHVLHCHAYRMRFEGSSVQPRGEGQQDGYSNYFLGNSPAGWHSGVRDYAVARYTEVYPNTDLEIYTASAALKYNWIVHPGGNPQTVALVYEGTDGVDVDRDGNLRVRTTVNDVVELRPYVFQMHGDKEVEVKSHWSVERTKDGYRIGIEVGSYDSTKDLVIDPTLIFSTYTGSTADNWGTTAAYDSHKNVYTAGLVFGIGYPVSIGAYDENSNGNADIGIFKFDSSGTQRLWATYLGGAAADMPHSMFVNLFDELLVMGTTGSDNFPVTAGAFQSAHAGGQTINYEGSSTINFAEGSDIFVSRLSADGTQLKASTYVGGTGNDGLNYKHYFNSSYQIIMAGNDSLYYNYGDGARGEIISDNFGNVYVGSTTMSTDFPTTAEAFLPSYAARQEGVAFKLDYNLRNMIWSSYIGGTNDDAVYSIDLDSSYNLLVCGGTNSYNFPTTAGAYRTTYQGGTADGFVSKISADGSTLLASTYVGSTAYDQLYFVRTGRRDEVFLFGQTKATGSTMIHNAGYSVPGGGMLLMRMTPDMLSDQWSTVFGTPGRVNLSPTAFAADICNRVYAAGWGRDFVNYNGVQWYTAGTTGMETTTDAFQDSTDGQDFYLISIDADANNLEYATFFGELHGNSGSSYGGGDHVDGGTSRFDRLATLYQSVCGSCSGTQGFPTTANAWSDSNLSSNCNNAIFRFNVTDDFPVAEFIPPTSGCAPYTVHLQNTGRGTAYLWDFGDGSTSTETSPTHTFTSPGVYTIRLIAAMPGGCADFDTTYHTLQVLSSSEFSHTPLVGCGGSTQIGVPPTLGIAYFWTGDPVSDPSVSNPWVNQAGTYVLHSVVAGCVQIDTFTVRTYTIVDEPLLTAIHCHDSANGSALLPLGAEISSDSITYTITPSAASQLTDSAILFSGLGAGSYTVTIDGYGCTTTRTFTLANPEPPAYEKEVSPALCDDSCGGWIHLTYDLSAVPEIEPRDTIVGGLCAGSYITTLTSFGCPLTDTSVIVREHLLDSLRAYADAERVYVGESVRLHATLDADAAGVGFRWSPAGDLDDPTAQHPLATPTDTLACYTVVATAPSGCTATDSVCIHGTEVICGAPIFVIPNAFTPNADGINDRICFNSDELIEFSITIFNRWGEKVYESDDPTECWDGTYRGHQCLAGVYTYTCHIRCLADIENDFKGDITLIK